MKPIDGIPHSNRLINIGLAKCFAKENIVNVKSIQVSMTKLSIQVSMTKTH
jgi:hypothetical protein